MAPHPDRDVLIADHWYLVALVAGTMTRGQRDWSATMDAESAAGLGLLQAAERFDPEGGANFATFAQLRMRGAIRDDWRRNRFGSRKAHERGWPVPEILSLHSSAENTRELVAKVPAEVETEDDIVDRLEPAEDSVPDLLDLLPARWRFIVVASLWEGRSLRNIGIELGVSETRVWQIRRQAYQLMRDAA